MMAGALSLEVIQSRLPNLPYNYMPAGLASLRGEPGAPGRPIFPMTPAEAEGSLVSSFSSGVIGNPLKLDTAISALIERTPNFGDGELFLGPPCHDLDEGRVIQLDMPNFHYELESGYRKAVVIIDSGIAFWHDKFHKATGQSRFQEIFHLDVVTRSDGKRQASFKQVEAALRRDFRTKVASQPGGQRRAVEKLGAEFPGSFFGANPAVDGFWHGTAVADLAGGDCDDTLLFGLELPSVAVQDYGGNTLQALFPSLLDAALKMTAKAKHLPTVIVLAYACPGGPHDGTYPVAECVSSFLSRTNPPHGDRNVTLVLPAGNHLQDRCCARLPANSGGRLRWSLAHDDRSANTVEICLDRKDWAAITLQGPGTTQVSVTPGELPPGFFAKILLDGEPIGGIHNLIKHDGHKLRLALAHTALKPGGKLPAPAGDWQIGVTSAGQADFWILRDDREDPDRIPSVFSDAHYRERRWDGGYEMGDPSAGTIRRSGTASIYTASKLAIHDLAHVIFAKGSPGLLPTRAGADEVVAGQIRPAPYGGLSYFGAQMPHRETVDIGEPFNGLEAVHNGTSVILERFSGTSAAAALAARKLL